MQCDVYQSLSIAPLRLITGNLPMVNRNHPPLELVNDLDIVRGEQYRGAVFIYLFEQAHNVPTMLWVEVACRLVGN